MSTTITRTKAKYLTIAYQAIAGVCLLGAIALGVLGLPESAATAQITSVAEAAQNQPSGTNAAADQTPSAESNEPADPPAVQVDTVSIAARLTMLDNAPKLQEPIVETTTVPDEVPAFSNESAAFIKRVTYTGYIRDSEKPLAFLRIDGAQRIVPRGAVARAGSMGLDDLTIKEVYPSYIVVTDGETEERIDLKDQSGASVTMASGAEIVVSDIPQTMDEVVLTQEQLDELASLPSKRRALREKAMRREALGIEQSKGNTRQPIASYRAGLSGGNTNRSRSNESNRE